MKVDVTNICHCWMCKKLLDCSPNTNYHTAAQFTVEQDGLFSHGPRHSSRREGAYKYLFTQSTATSYWKSGCFIFIYFANTQDLCQDLYSHLIT